MQAQTGMSTNAQLATDTWELDEKFTGLANKDGSMTIAGFGSLLSGALSFANILVAYMTNPGGLAYTHADPGTNLDTHAERSARTTFPDLENFRPAKVLGWRRVFAHTADIFFVRGIANMNTVSIEHLPSQP